MLITADIGKPDSIEARQTLQATCAVTYPFHNLLMTALKQFAIVNLTVRTSCRFRCTMHRICFMRENGRIGSPLTFDQIQRQHLAIQIVALGLRNIRTTLYNVVLTRNSAARISNVAR